MKSKASDSLVQHIQKLSLKDGDIVLVDPHEVKLNALIGIPLPHNVCVVPWKPGAVAHVPARLLAIVRGLAREDPVADGFCVLCGEHDHTADCPYRMAVEFLKEM